MRVFLSIILFLLLDIPVFAGKGEESRILVHTLNYISHDYYFAVRDGKILSQDEYSEELEFSESAVKYYHQFSSQWSDKDSADIGILIHHLDSIIGKHAPFKDVSALATQTKNEVIRASGLIITPSKFPNLQNGKIVFKTECAKCHGETGYGNGLDGKELDPPPRNFQDNERMRTISPFTAYNTIRLGIPGTGMKSHPTLDDDQVWDVAFYVVSLRYQPLSNNPFLKKETTEMFVDSISKETIATKSDDELAALYPLKDTIKQKLLLAAIRLRQAKAGESEFINTSLHYLSGAMELYLLGKYNDASQLASLSYLEGIEPIENQIKASDPDLLSRIEVQMQGLRKMMGEKHDVIEVQDSLNAVRFTISTANELLQKKSYSFWLALLMAASILLREGLEAFLVIMVILSILKAGNLKSSALWVHVGWVAAVAVGIVIWLVGGNFMQHQQQHLELIEGIISFVAVVMLLYIGFWLHGKSEVGRWKNYVKKMMQGVVESESNFSLAALSFFVVFREVFESVLFLSALNIESGGKQSAAIGFGVIAAFVFVIALAYVVLRFSTTLPIPTLFKLSSFVMGILAVILGGKGIHSFQELNLISVHSAPVFRVELLGIYPTLETCIAQLIILLIFIAVWKITTSPKQK